MPSSTAKSISAVNRLSTRIRTVRPVEQNNWVSSSKSLHQLKSSGVWTWVVVMMMVLVTLSLLVLVKIRHLIFQLIFEILRPFSDDVSCRSWFCRVERLAFGCFVVVLLNQLKNNKSQKEISKETSNYSSKTQSLSQIWSSEMCIKCWYSITAYHCNILEKYWCIALAKTKSAIDVYEVIWLSVGQNNWILWHHCFVLPRDPFSASFFCLVLHLKC